MSEVPAKPRFLDQARAAIRARHYSRRTEEAYVFWIRKLIVFHGKRHPAGLREAEMARRRCITQGVPRCAGLTR
jgi:hypothetical protein